MSWSSTEAGRRSVRALLRLACSFGASGGAPADFSSSAAPSSRAEASAYEHDVITCCHLVKCVVTDKQAAEHPGRIRCSQLVDASRRTVPTARAALCEAS